MGVELIYFAVYGRAGVTRLMLKLANMDFTDTRIPTDSPEEYAKMKAEAPLGQVPVLKMDDQMFCQEKAINEFCAKKAGLIPTCDVEKLKVDMLLETLSEIQVSRFMQSFGAVAKEFPPSPENPFLLADNSEENRFKRAYRIGSLVGKGLTEEIQKLEKLLGMTQTNSKFAVGDKMTLVDLSILSMFRGEHDRFFKDGFKELRTAAPKCAAIADSAMENPTVAQYMKDNESLPHTGLGIMY